MHNEITLGSFLPLMGDVAVPVVVLAPFVHTHIRHTFFQAAASLTNLAF